jgi:hypothetical protein
MMRKLVISIFVISLFGATSASASSLSDVFYALSSSRDDLPNGYVEITNAETLLRRVDKHLSCSWVSKEEIIAHYDRGVHYMQDFYYDEDLPYERSREAFIAILGKKEYQACLYREDLENPYYQRIIKTIYRPLGSNTPAFLFEEGQR